MRTFFWVVIHVGGSGRPSRARCNNRRLSPESCTREMITLTPGISSVGLPRRGLPTARNKPFLWRRFMCVAGGADEEPNDRTHLAGVVIGVDAWYTRDIYSLSLFLSFWPLSKPM